MSSSQSESFWQLKRCHLCVSHARPSFCLFAEPFLPSCQSPPELETLLVPLWFKLEVNKGGIFRAVIAVCCLLCILFGNGSSVNLLSKQLVDGCLIWRYLSIHAKWWKQACVWCAVICAGFNRWMEALQPKLDFFLGFQSFVETWHRK